MTAKCVSSATLHPPTKRFVGHQRPSMKFVGHICHNMSVEWT